MKTWQRRFTAEGLNLERLIRQAGEKGIALSGIRRLGSRKLRGQVDEADAAALQMLAEKGGWGFTLGMRLGLGRLADGLRRRIPLAVMCVLVLAAVICASRMMWQVSIQGAGVYEADLRAYLDEVGIRPVRWKSGVDPAALRDALEWRYPDVAWVEVGWRGMTLQVNVVTGTAVGDTIDLSGQGDVVAARDGVISSVVTVAGTPMVKRGDVVRRGQVLISGEERTLGEAVRPVSARGVVMARVWDGASVRMSVSEQATVYTGRTQQAQTVRLPWFNLSPMEDSGFEQQDISVREMPLGGLFWPTVIRTETRMEAAIRRQGRDLEAVKAEAGVAAMRLLRQKIGLDDDLVDKWVDYSMIDDEELVAVAIGERMIDIAQPQKRRAP